MACGIHNSLAIFVFVVQTAVIKPYGRCITGPIPAGIVHNSINIDQPPHFQNSQ
jgi:hypothetical protein